MPLTTSAFDLPDNLSPKADPALIGSDEEHFAAIAESLEETIAELSDRLADLRRSPGGHVTVAHARDTDDRPAAMIISVARLTILVAPSQSSRSCGAQPGRSRRPRARWSRPARSP